VQNNHEPSRGKYALQAAVSSERLHITQGLYVWTQLFSDEGGAAVVTSVLQRGAHDANESMQQVTTSWHSWCTRLGFALGMQFTMCQLDGSPHLLTALSASTCRR
jgi:hypothetical protein